MGPNRHSAPGRGSAIARRARAAALGAAAACASAIVSGADGPPASGAARPGAVASASETAPADGVTLAVLDAEARFGRGGSALPAEARVIVERLAGRLAALERVLSVRVIGHADNVGEAADNLALSRRRAESVAVAFRERWPGVHTLAVGAGEAHPVASNDTEAGRARNRRVEIQVIGLGRPDDFDPASASIDASAPGTDARSSIPPDAD